MVARPIDPFAEYACELFAGLGPVSARRMFGGYGLYVDGLMFGILVSETLYLKVDTETRATFEREDCVPFEYDKQGKAVSLSYYTLPADAMESPALALPWGRLAFAAALRGRSAKAAKASTRPSKSVAKQKPTKQSSAKAPKSPSRATASCVKK